MGLVEKSARVLCIAPDETLLLSHWRQASGLQVVHVSDLEEACPQLALNGFDLILFHALDASAIGAVEALTHLVSTPVIVISEHKDIAARLKGLGSEIWTLAAAVSVEALGVMVSLRLACRGEDHSGPADSHAGQLLKFFRRAA